VLAGAENGSEPLRRGKQTGGAAGRTRQKFEATGREGQLGASLERYLGPAWASRRGRAVAAGGRGRYCGRSLSSGMLQRLHRPRYSVQDSAGVAAGDGRGGGCRLVALGCDAMHSVKGQVFLFVEQIEVVKSEADDASVERAKMEFELSPAAAWRRRE
jgi:hypothetical protein